MALSLATKQQKSTPIRVLVVEDEGLIAAHISSLLKKGGYEVAGMAESSEEALAHAKAENPDLILMDIRIKGELDGIQVAEKIRGNFDIPVIFLTSHTDQETIQRAKMTGSAGFLTKPIHATTLATAIDMGIFRYSAERALRKEQVWMTTLLSVVPEAIVIFDLSGRIRYFSPAAEQITGCCQEQALSGRISEILPLAQSGSGLAANELYSIEPNGASKFRLAAGLTADRRSGEKFLIEGEISPSIDDEKVIGAVLTFRDVGPGS